MKNIHYSLISFIVAASLSFIIAKKFFDEQRKETPIHHIKSDTLIKGERIIPSRETLDQMSERLGYNPWKDSLVCSQLEHLKPSREFKYKHIDYLILQGKLYRITATHYEFAPYEQQESWYFEYWGKDGQTLMISGDDNSNKLKTETYERLKTLLKSV